MQFYRKMLFALWYELIFVVLIFCVLISNSTGSCYEFTTTGAQRLLIKLIRIVFSLQLDINVERFGKYNLAESPERS